MNQIINKNLTHISNSHTKFYFEERKTNLCLRFQYLHAFYVLSAVLSVGQIIMKTLIFLDLHVKKKKWLIWPWLIKRCFIFPLTHQCWDARGSFINIYTLCHCSLWKFTYVIYPLQYYCWNSAKFFSSFLTEIIFWKIPLWAFADIAFLAPLCTARAGSHLSLVYNLCRTSFVLKCSPENQASDRCFINVLLR